MEKEKLISLAVGMRLQGYIGMDDLLDVPDEVLIAYNKWMDTKLTRGVGNQYYIRDNTTAQEKLDKLMRIINEFTNG